MPSKISVVYKTVAERFALDVAMATPSPTPYSTEKYEVSVGAEYFHNLPGRPDNDFSTEGKYYMNAAIFACVIWSAAIFAVVIASAFISAVPMAPAAICAAPIEHEAI